MRRASPFWTALGLSAVILLGGCSGGDDNPTAARAPTTSVAGTTATTSSGFSSGVNQSSDPYCVFLRSYNERFNRVDLNVADPQVLRRLMQEAAAAAKEAEGSAPAAIKSDLATLNRGFDRLLTALQQINYDLTKATPAMLQDLQAPEFVAAGQRVDAYRRDHCL